MAQLYLPDGAYGLSAASTGRQDRKPAGEAFGGASG
jgi:hypothetical protein